ncbi:MAG TPA: hypothetical protein VGJ18_14105 [Gemmatimonadaceae bacterium]|jgi:hypothetical protein
MRLARAFLLVSAVASSACNSPTNPSYQPLRPSSNGTAVTLENPNAVPIYYMLANPEFLALADFAACVSPSCPNVPAHGAVHVPYTQIAGYEQSESTATLSQWRLTISPSGTNQRSDFGAVDVPLR